MLGCPLAEGAEGDETDQGALTLAAQWLDLGIVRDSRQYRQCRRPRSSLRPVRGRLGRVDDYEEVR